jgi:hypothetical protein
MPFFSLLMPRTFQKKYPAEMRNLRLNSKKLTTPFDIHETLLHFLNFEKKFINTANTKKMPRGISLFKYISPNRTCENAQIEPHWCSCLNWNDINIKKKIANLNNSTDAEINSIDNEYNRILKENIEIHDYIYSNESRKNYYKEYDNIKKGYYIYTKSALVLAFKAIEFINSLIGEDLKLYCEKLHLLSIQKISQLNLNQKLLLFKESKDIHGREAIFHDLKEKSINISNFSYSKNLKSNNIDDEFLSFYFKYRSNSSKKYMDSINYMQYNNSYNELNSFVDTEITFQITFNTWPGNGSFEMSLKYDLKNSQLVFNKNEISRINTYHNTSNCINNIRPDMRQFCYCKFS